VLRLITDLHPLDTGTSKVTGGWVKFNDSAGTVPFWYFEVMLLIRRMESNECGREGNIHKGYY
jgi:hypothetical protein